MSNYPDNFSNAAFEAAYGDDEREYPTWDEITAIAQRHLGPAFKAMADEIAKASPHMGYAPFVKNSLDEFLSLTISDGLTETLNSAFVKAVNAGE